MVRSKNKSIVIVITLYLTLSIFAVAQAGTVINASSYGVKCDNVTDDTTALQSFFNALGVNSAGFIQPGRCLFASTLAFPTNRATVKGAGQYSTVLVYNGSNTNIDLLSVSSTSTGPVPGFVTISDLMVTSTTVMTSGAALHLKNVGFIILQNIVADGQSGTGNLYDGIWFEATDMVRLEGFEARGQDDALRISARGVGNGAQFDAFVSHGKIASSKIGVHVGGGFDNFHIDNTEITSNGTNVVIDHTVSPYKNQELFFGPGVVTDQAKSGDNYYISDDLADRTNYCNIVISGAITGSVSGSGIRIKDWPNCFVTIQSPYIIANNRSGIQVDDASAILNVSPSTIITGNGRYGIDETFASNSLINTGAALSNTLGQYSPNVGGSVSFPVQLSSGSNVQISTKEGISAAGTTYDTATQLSTQYSFVGISTPGQGVRLPSFINTEMLVQNTSASNNLVVYPPVGARYGAAPVNGGASINAAAALRIVCTSSTQCWVN